MTVDDLRKQQIDAQFGRAADQYASSEHKDGADLALMVELAKLGGDEVVLDIASGAGHTALYFAPHVKHVVVTDMADKMIDKARSLFAEGGHTNAEFKVVDAQSLPFPAASFDVVTCRIAPHHFLDIKGAMQEVARVLKPGGRYLVVDSMSPENPEAASFLHGVEVLRDPTHVRSYTREEWASFAEAAGLVVEFIGIHRKRRRFDFWLDRGGANGDLRTQLIELFRDAPDTVRQEFDIEVENGKVVAFSDDKVVIAARRP